jgi:flagellar hook-length control protein FliK
VNSSGGASTGGLNGATRVLEREESRHDRDGEAAAALWVALAQQVTTAQALPSASTEEQSAPPSAWHPSAGDLTPGSVMAPTAGGAPADASASQRLVLRVDGGALGELEVTLDRKDGQLNVVIGMENQHLVGSMLPDASALRTALEGAGISVQSLNVVLASEVGTVLAQRRLSLSGTKPSAQQGAEQNPETDRKRNHKRLTLIG